MADNTPQNGTASVATDDVGGNHYQRFKLDLGGDGLSSPVVDSMPITGIPVAYTPSYGGPADSVANGIPIDPSGQVSIRGNVMTDEGTFRVNFANTSLAVGIGSVTIVGDVVTGTGFDGTYDVHYQDYFKLDADGESAWVQIDSIDSDTQLTLRSAYVGGSSGAASRALIRPVTGSGGAISVASGQLTMTTGTTNAAITRVTRNVDIAPMVYRSRVSFSQRIANQTFRLGLSESFTTSDRWFARFKIDGTTNTTVICESGRNPTTTPSASETESTTVTLPGGVTTVVLNDYRVEVLTEKVNFFINSILVASHTRAIPAQHDDLEASITCINGTGAASSTTVVADYITGKNHNKLEIGVMSDTEQMLAAATPLQSYNYSVAGVIAINTDILIISCSQIRAVSLQATSIGTTGRLDFFLTNDLSVTGTAQPAYPIGGGAGVTTTTAAGSWTIPTNGFAFLRVRIGVATTAGTTTVFANGSQSPIANPLPTTQPVSGTVTANIGTGSLAAGTNAIGDVGIQYRANATGAATTFKFNSAATTNSTLVLTGARRLIGYTLTNTTAAIKYFKFYNKATAPTVGTDTPLFVVGVPATSTVNHNLPGGIAIALGLGIGCTGAVADADTTATAVNDVVGAVHYV